MNIENAANSKIPLYGIVTRLWILQPALASIALLLGGNSYALATICLESTIGISVENEPNHLNSLVSNYEEWLFDGSATYSGDANLRFHHPIAVGDNALILAMNLSLQMDTTFEIFYEVDDSDGRNAQSIADALNANAYGSWYWDLDNNSVLDGSDFDINGDGMVNLGTGDYSPLGLVIQLYNGDPGNPVGSGSGTLVHTAYSPIQLLESAVYSFTIAAPADFDYLVIESTPDGDGSDPRVIEIQHNANTNSVQGSNYGSSQNCGLAAHFQF